MAGLSALKSLISGGASVMEKEAPAIAKSSGGFFGKASAVAAEGAAGYGAGKLAESFFSGNDDEKGSTKAYSNLGLSGLGMQAAAGGFGGGGGGYEPPPISMGNGGGGGIIRVASNDNSRVTLATISGQLNAIIGVLNQISTDNRNMINLARFKNSEDNKNAREKFLEHYDAQRLSDAPGSGEEGGFKSGVPSSIKNLGEAAMLGGAAYFVAKFKDITEAIKNHTKEIIGATTALAVVKNIPKMWKGFGAAIKAAEEGAAHKMAGTSALNQYMSGNYKKPSVIGMADEDIGKSAIRKIPGFLKGGAKGGLLSAGFESLDYFTGKKKATANNLGRSATGVVAGELGWAGGAAIGAEAGAALGSIIPVVGTAVGAFGGGLLGGIYGMYKTREVAEEGYNGIFGQDSSSKPTLTGKEKAAGMSPNAKFALEFFKKKGYSEAQAAGIVGNLQQESGRDLNVNAQNSIGMYGIAQWDKKRRARFREKYGKDIKGSSLQEQLEYVDWELSHGEMAGAIRSKLKTAHSAEEAAQIFEHFYERSGGSKVTNRMANAVALDSSSSLGASITPSSVAPSSQPSAKTPVTQLASINPPSVKPSSGSNSSVPDPSASHIIKEYQTYFTSAA